MIRRLKNGINIIFYIVLGGLIISRLLTISSNSQVISDLIGYRNFTILTGSMEPVIKPGDIVIIKKVNPAKIKENDIITYKLDATYITHRVIKIKDGNFITKGDNNNIEDSIPVSGEQVVGIEKVLIPKLGYFIAFISRTAVKAILVSILCVLIALDILNNKSKEGIAIK